MHATIQQGDSPCVKQPTLDVAVDMDGTLLKTDTLVEGFVWALFHRPGVALNCLLSLPKGRAAVKETVCEISAEGALTYPLREELVEWLQLEKRKGRRLHLVTAAHVTVAKGAADHVAMFDSVIATEGQHNLKGELKRAALNDRFPDGWTYVGDSKADIPVFQGARSAVLAGHQAGLQKAVERLGVPIEAAFPGSSASLKDWLKACRVHQWSKNLLIFIPLVLSGAFMAVEPFLDTLIAFFLLSLCASGTYLLNDLADLRADRQHKTKCQRPLASARLPIASGLIAAWILILGSIGVAAAMMPIFGLMLLIYTVTTVTYSMGFKRLALFDVTILASLFTLRLAMGAVAADVALSGWLTAFSLSFFLSLSMAKRTTEIVKYEGKGFVPGRGYLKSDLPLVLSFGISTGMVAMLLMILFLVFAAFETAVYARPEFLLATPPLTFLWLSRVWLLASRGELKDDPVVFALRDPPSLGLGAIMGLVTLAAVIGPFS